MTLVPVHEATDVEADGDSERRSLDTDLGRRLSQLSSSAKFAFTLNQINRVAIHATYDREEDGGTVTMYVMDVFLQDVQKGIPRTPAESPSKRKGRLQRDKEKAHAEYQVTHRYSAFRLLRERIMEVVTAPSDEQHPEWCAYCSRVMWLVTSDEFPSRFPNHGPVATYTGWHKLLVYSRKHGLERYVNLLLGAAKDVSYRYGAIQCERYPAVSHLLNDFLAEPHLRSSGWGK
ncbi:hypothetical protein BBJ28_00001605 [Nothophytophthora sp. Chile5]|nr:hypothetical protein BBJ28_00001605 [Nothophytophthora sp. Chile5]